MRKIVLLVLLVFSMTTLAYGESKSDVKVVYNTKNLDFGGKSVVNNDGAVYIPLRALSENLYYKVDWFNDTNTVKIHDNLSNVTLNMNGDVEINGVKSTNEKTPIKVNGSVYVPLRFVSEALGVDVNYNAKTKSVNMQGRDIYEIDQKNIYKPYLIAYTKDGRKEVCLITEKNTKDDVKYYGLDWYKTKILSVNRTPQSDVVFTKYDKGMVGYTYNVYVKNGKMIDISNRRTESYDKYTYKAIDPYNLENRVALLNEGTDYRNYIKIYDDTTGKMIYKINVQEILSKELKDANFGSVFNIQAVGEDFVVVSVYLPHYTKDISKDGAYFFTTIINLKTKEITPVHEHLKRYDPNVRFPDTESLMAGMYTRDSIPYDNMIFDSITSDGKLKFVVPSYNEENVKQFEWLELEY